MAYVGMVYNANSAHDSTRPLPRQVRYLSGYFDFQTLGRQLHREALQVGWTEGEQQIAISDGGNGLEDLECFSPNGTGAKVGDGLLRTRYPEGEGGRPMNEKKRRKWTASEKLRIVLVCMQPGVEVSEVCRREGISPTMYYTWKKRLLASAGQIFDERSKKGEAERERTEREMTRMKGVIAEITAENLELKKTLSG
jgi:transposase